MRDDADERILMLIKTAIKACGNANRLAKELGVTPGAISHWLSEKNHPVGRYVLLMQDLVRERNDAAIENARRVLELANSSKRKQTQANVKGDKCRE